MSEEEKVHQWDKSPVVDHATLTAKQSLGAGTTGSGIQFILS
jgi:hypothetical protein